jgi:predicted short-subunit dehydrogenase-like oxidoreductase (DUF2520 family)
MSPLVKSGHRGTIQQGPHMQKMTDATISEIDDDEDGEAALRAAEELGERIFTVLDDAKSYFVQLNAIAACLAVMLYGNYNAELLLRMFGDKVLHDLRVMAEIERGRSSGTH